MEHNGGWPKPGCFWCPSLEEQYVLDFLCQVSGSGYEPDTTAPIYSLQRSLSNVGMPIPKRFFLFGIASSYNPLLLDLDGGDGSVWMKDAEALGPPLATNPNWTSHPRVGLHRVAAGFEEFLKRLEPDRFFTREA